MGVWKPQMINTLLAHLEQNMGIHGLYVQDIRQAAQQAAAQVNRSHPQRHAVTHSQVERKLRALHTEHKAQGIGSIMDLYRQGRTALDAQCQPDVLLALDPGSRHTFTKNAKGVPKAR